MDKVYQSNKIISKLAPSANDFIKRIDAIEEVTPIHYIWLLQHENDQHTTIEELYDEINTAEKHSPIRSDSKSGTLRTLAYEYDKLRMNAAAKGQVWKDGFDWGRFVVYLLGRWRIISQVFRIPILFCTLFITLYVYKQFIQYESIHYHYNQLQQPFNTQVQDDFPLFTFYTFLLCMILTLYQCYILFFDDEIFARSLWKWSSASKEGLYIHPNDQRSQIIAQNMPLLYEREKYPCGWINGDLQTLIPTLLYDDINLNLPYISRYIRNPLDNEGFGIDIAFPYDNNNDIYYHIATKPIMIFHHGLNGSSRASYIQCAIELYNSLGHTCIAMNVRGFGGGFILRHPFLGTRVTDVHYTITLAHIGAGNNTIDNLISYTRQQPYSLRSNSLYIEPQLLTFTTVFKNNITPMDLQSQYTYPNIITTPICLIGYSMGGIITSNYCTYYSQFTGLQSAFAICALGDRNRNKHNQGERDWELALSDELKKFITKIGVSMYKPFPDVLTNEQRYIDLNALSNATSIRHFDSIFTRVVHGKATVEHYYHDLSFGTSRKLELLQTPLFIMHCANDPVVHVDNLYPICQSLLSKDKQNNNFKLTKHRYYTSHNNIGNLIIYILRHGGHVGSFETWGNDKWNFITQLTYQYHNAVYQYNQLHGMKQPRQLPLFCNQKPYYYPQLTPQQLIASKSISSKYYVTTPIPNYQLFSLESLEQIDYEHFNNINGDDQSKSKQQQRQQQQDMINNHTPTQNKSSQRSITTSLSTTTTKRRNSTSRKSVLISEVE